MNANMSHVATIILEKFSAWKESLLAMLPNFIVAVLAMLAFYVLGKLVKRLAQRLLVRVSKKAAINNLLASLFYLLTILTGLIVALNILHLQQTVTSLLAGAGIVGLALGFAFQDISANFISGIIIAFRRPIKVGDIIEVEDHFGQVERIDLRTTRIETFQGLHIIIPNRLIIQNPLTNLTYTRDRRIDLDVGVSYGEDLEKVKSVVLNTIKSLKGITSENSVAFFYREFGSSSIDFTVVFWIHYKSQMHYLEMRSDAIIAIKKAFDDEGITIPFPIRTLDFGIKGGKPLSEMALKHTNLTAKNEA